MALLFGLDRLAPAPISLIPLFVLGPLLAALGSGARGTAAIGVLALALALVDVAGWTAPDESQDAIRVATVALGSALAVWVAALRSRLQTTAARYASLMLALSEVGEGMVVMEEDGRCVYANPAFERLSGYTSAELAALPSVLALVDGPDRDEARRRVIGRLRHGLVDPGYGFGIRRRDGARVELEVAGVPLEAGGRRQLVIVGRDVTARRRAEAERARLYAERDHVARTLQRSLLPAALPQVPGVELAARYVAAGQGNEVGGDFYDCFATGGGDWALVIGDVCGKGAEAAALTALARHTLRAAVLHTRRPSSVLGELNEALVRQGLDYRFCTVLYASLTPREGHVTATVATGGHPLPLVLRAGGRVDTAGRPGTLLGIVEHPEISEETLELEPGDALVLFTDGVIEATAADREIGPDRFAGFLATCAGACADGIAAAVEREALASHGDLPRDDVAVVVARVRGGAPTPFGAVGQGVAQTT